jgi:hypothetical protein
MRCPGLFVFGGAYNTVTYAELFGPGAHRLLIPKSRFSDRLFYGLWADLFEIGSEFQPGHGQIEPHEGDRIFRKLQVPAYVAPMRPKNVHYAKSANGDGLALKQREAMVAANTDRIERERRGGYGFRTTHSDSESSTRSAADGDPVRTATNAEAARTAWLGFLPNYFRPFVNNNVLPQTARSSYLFGLAGRLRKG